VGYPDFFAPLIPCPQAKGIISQAMTILIPLTILTSLHKPRGTRAKGAKNLKTRKLTPSPTSRISDHQSRDSSLPLGMTRVGVVVQAVHSRYADGNLTLP
jgi:hypothetical protein